MGRERWAVITRVSFMGERKAGSASFHADQDQIDEATRYAAGYDAELDFLPPELDVSGGRPISERPSLRRAIEGVEAGTYTGILAAYLSRLTRSRSGIEIWERVEAAGGHVHCARENLDTSTPNGRYIRDIHLANAVREREEHEVRFDVRRELATNAGVWQRRQLPRGYDKDPQTRGLVPSASHAEIPEIFADVLAGTPIIKVAERIGMSNQGLRYLLRNRVYLGELKVGQHVNRQAHEPLLDVELFDRVQALLQSRVRQPKAASAHKGPALLAGIVRCVSCGHVMTRGRNGRLVVYTCPRRSAAGRCPAPTSIVTGRLDEYVTELALQQLEQLRVKASAAIRALEAGRARLRQAEGELVAYLEATSALSVSADALRAGALAREQAVDDARAEVRRAEALLPLGPDVSDAAEAWELLNDHGRNQLLRSLVHVVLVRGTGARGGAAGTIADRVRVLAAGADYPLPLRIGGPEVPLGITPLRWPDLDDEDLIGVLRVQ